MGFLNKETKKGIEKKREPAEKVNPEVEETKTEGDLRIVTSDQLMNLKLDGLGQYMKDLETSFNMLNEEVKKAMEE